MGVMGGQGWRKDGDGRNTGTVGGTGMAERWQEHGHGGGMATAEGQGWPEEWGWQKDEDGGDTGTTRGRGCSLARCIPSPGDAGRAPELGVPSPPRLSGVTSHWGIPGVTVLAPPGGQKVSFAGGIDEREEDLKSLTVSEIPEDPEGAEDDEEDPGQEQDGGTGGTWGITPHSPSLLSPVPPRPALTPCFCPQSGDTSASPRCPRAPSAPSATRPPTRWAPVSWHRAPGTGPPAPPAPAASPVPPGCPPPAACASSAVRHVPCAMCRVPRHAGPRRDASGPPATAAPSPRALCPPGCRRRSRGWDPRALVGSGPPLAAAPPAPTEQRPPPAINGCTEAGACLGGLRPWGAGGL